MPAYTLTFTALEIGLLKDAMEELCNDCDLLYCRPDDGRYEQAGALYDRLCKYEQEVVIPH
ncbi:MAG: hypothetical protein EBR82_63505 [Caulobacteraceae bacterium]|nr:hypothetical protein [Caulobacteraceae bacterium]